MQLYRTRCFAGTLCVIVGLVAGCGDKQPAPQNSQEATSVTVQVAEPQQLPLTVETVGRTEGSKEVQLRARVSGILEKQLYNEGAAVKAGTVLFRIDPVPFEIALERARATLAQAQATRQQARRNADRFAALVQQNAISRRDADDALSAVEASEAAALAAQAEVRDAQVNLSYTRVTAPISGVTGRAEQSEGSLVTAASESSLLTTLTQTDPIWVRFALSVDEYEALRAAGARDTAALSVELLNEDGSTRLAAGRVNFSASLVDPTLGTVQLRAEFPNAQLSLLPGEYLRVRLSGGELAGITVPQVAVLQGAQGPFVWIANAQNQAEQRPVRTGSWVGDRWRVLEGLAAGDRVIIDNLLRLKAGAAVIWQPAATAADEPAPQRQTSPATPRATAGGA